MIWHIPEYFGIFHNIPKYSKIFQNIPEYSYRKVVLERTFKPSKDTIEVNKDELKYKKF